MKYIAIAVLLLLSHALTALYAYNRGDMESRPRYYFRGVCHAATYYQVHGKWPGLDWRNRAQNDATIDGECPNMASERAEWYVRVMEAK